jgi:hypothetical protein
LEGDLNALGLLLVILLTGAVLVRHGTRTGSLRRAPLAIVAAFVVMVLAAILVIGFDDEMDPSHQLLIAAVCLALLLAYTRPGEVRTIAALGVAASTFVLSMQIPQLVGRPVYPYASSPTYTASPRWSRKIVQRNSRSQLHEVRSWLDPVAEDDNHEYPAGWLAESPLRQFFPPSESQITRSEAVEFHPFWHSSLTGLYARRYHELDMWYPGGRLKEGLKRLEFRPRQHDGKR